MLSSHLKFKFPSTTKFCYSEQDKMFQGIKVSISWRHSDSLLLEQPQVSIGRFTLGDIYFLVHENCLYPLTANQHKGFDHTLFFISPCSVWSHLKYNITKHCFGTAELCNFFPWQSKQLIALSCTCQTEPTCQEYVMSIHHYHSRAKC